MFLVARSTPWVRFGSPPPLPARQVWVPRPYGRAGRATRHPHAARETGKPSVARVREGRADGLARPGRARSSDATVGSVSRDVGGSVLTSEQNERLTRVEGDAPMGVLMREHRWIPAVLSLELLADG